MSPNAQDHSDWMDAFFASYHVHHPVNATFIGHRDFDDRLPDCSESALGDLLADAQDLLRRSESSGDDLAPHEDIDRRLARGVLRIQEWEVQSTHFQRGNPSYFTGEAVFSVLGLFLNRADPIRHLAHAATRRMEAIPAFLAQARRLVREAPHPWTARARRECDGAVALFTEGTAELRTLHGLQDPAFENAAIQAAAAFVEHGSWLDAELARTGSSPYACGPEAFDLYLKEGHFLEESAASIAEYAEDAMLEAEAAMQAKLRQLGFDSPGGALMGLRKLHPSAADYYGAYTGEWESLRRLSEEERLLTWPDFPIRYVPRPAWTRAAAPHLYFLFYRSPAALGRPPVHDYLVAPLPDADEKLDVFLQANNNSVIKLNHVVHHGGLGHHVQNWYAFQSPSRIGRVAAVDCASRIAMFCGGTMAEGWACYATDLAAEVGALTELEQLAEIHGRMRIAARAIVDVRLHHGEMTLDQAAGFYESRAGMTGDAARAEAVKNSMFPGAASMYLVGTDRIHELRREIAHREGPDFELRRFHDTFLSHGSIPVALIAEQMTKGTDVAE